MQKQCSNLTDYLVQLCTVALLLQPSTTQPKRELPIRNDSTKKRILPLRQGTYLFEKEQPRKKQGEHAHLEFPGEQLAYEFELRKIAGTIQFVLFASRYTKRGLYGRKNKAGSTS